MEDLSSFNSVTEVLLFLSLNCSIAAGSVAYARQAAPEDVRRKIEQGAVRLAKRVGYRNAGTVEYLYNSSNGEISFLEVNPRLQVEHPVTEMITGINIPAVQLQVRSQYSVVSDSTATSLLQMLCIC